MVKKFLCVLGIFFLISPVYSYTISETENFIFSMGGYLRQDLVTFKNVVDLDSRNSGDTSAYLGIDYNLTLDFRQKDTEREFYLKLERNGPYDYGAPLFIHNTLTNTGGTIGRYRNEELLPQVEEFWGDTLLFNLARVKLGLYTYEVGNGFALNGAYENYGLTFYGESNDFSWHLYYCRPDIAFKNHLGPRVRQEVEQGIGYNQSAANFFAADIRFNQGGNSFQPYVGVLADDTSAAKRDNYFTAPIKRDILGTAGLAWNYKRNKLSYDMEIAHNFGKAESGDSQYKDIYHTGYLIYSGLDYKIGGFTSSFDFLLCSGNKATLDNVVSQDETISGNKNRAFSYYSPLNRNLLDSVSSPNVDILPIVAMGGGYGLQYGIPRPGTFASGDFDNLIMPVLGFDLNVTQKLTLGFYGYYLRSFEKGVGTFNGEAKYLSADLGKEWDIIIDYQLSANTLISVLGGYFLPGRYYKEERDDTSGSLLSPFVRGDASADSAYEVDVAMEFKF